MKKQLILLILTSSFLSLRGMLDEGYESDTENTRQVGTGNTNQANRSQPRITPVNCDRFNCRELAQLGRSVAHLPTEHKNILKTCCCETFKRSGPGGINAARALACQ